MTAADVVAWLRSPEGEEWSRDRALAGDDPGASPQTLWRPEGLLHAGSDPCGGPPVRVAVRMATQ